jgi:uncharacterized protein (DUF2252 family)
MGKALRDRLPRRQQAEWATRKRRDELVSMLKEAVAGRRADLLPIRWERMAVSAFGFYRGAASLMAADVGPQRSTGLEVQVCGDAHLLNLGAYAAPDGRLVFDLNDFDETCRGPFEWDLKRLAASLFVGGRVAGHQDADCAVAVRSLVRTYREHLERFSRLPVLELARLEVTRKSTGKPIAPIFTKAARDTPRQLIEKATNPGDGGFARFESRPPLQVPLERREARGVLDSLAGYRATLGPGRQHVLDAYVPWDTAFRVVGTGSVGVEDYLILLYGNGPDDPLFLQVKEEDSSCWRRYLEDARGYGRTYPHHGRRTAEGQFRTQTMTDPFLGWTQMAGKHFLVRQWSDHKAAVSVKMLEKGRVLDDYAVLCGQVLARAHARTGDGAILAGYCGTSERLDDALAAFARAYADQTEADYEQFCKAMKNGQFGTMRGGWRGGG